MYRLAAISGLAAAVLASFAMLATAPAASAAAWLSPHDLSAAGGDGETPRVAVDSRGDAVAVWQYGQDIQASFRPAGGEWSAPQRITDPSEGAAEPDVAMDASGDAVAVWETYDNGSSTYVIRTAALTADGGWGPAQDLETTAADAEDPHVAIDATGNAVAVWRRQVTNGAYVVAAADRPAGGAWGGAHDLSSAPSGTNSVPEGPQVAVNARGDAVAAWRRYSGSSDRIGVAFRPAGGTWQSSEDLSADGYEASAPAVAIAPSGNALAAWDDGSDPPKDRVHVSQRAFGGSWAAPQPISPATDSAAHEQVAFDPLGDAIAVWVRSNSAQPIVQAALMPAGGGWQAAQDLSSPGAGAPQAVLDAHGNAVVAWFRNLGGSVSPVEASTRPAGGAWQPVHPIDPLGDEPQLAVDPQGNAVLVYVGYDGSNDRARATAYDAAGPLLDSLSVPQATTVGVPVSFSVSPLDVWSPLGATSWAFGDGASAAGAQASHVYAAPGTYEVTAGALDSLGNQSTTAASVTVYPAPGAAPAPSHPFRGVRLRRQKILVRRGVASVRVACPVGTAGRCRGTLTLSARLAGKATRRGHLKRLLLGKAKFSIPPGRTARVRVRLRKPALRLLARKHTLGARLSASAGDGSGAKHSSSVAVSLKLKKR